MPEDCASDASAQQRTDPCRKGETVDSGRGWSNHHLGAGRKLEGRVVFRHRPPTSAHRILFSLHRLDSFWKPYVASDGLSTGYGMTKAKKRFRVWLRRCKDISRLACTPPSHRLAARRYGFSGNEFYQNPNHKGLSRIILL